MRAWLFFLLNPEKILFPIWSQFFTEVEKKKLQKNTRTFYSCVVALFEHASDKKKTRRVTYMIIGLVIY